MATRVTMAPSNPFGAAWPSFAVLATGGELGWLDKPEIDIGDPLGQPDVRIIRRSRMGRRFAGFQAHVQRDGLCCWFTHIRLLRLSMW